MKTFQKIALVSAIAAAPFAAQADLTPMDDALMGDTTGQAGVTIEINIQDAISIGEIEYTDTAHLEGSVSKDGGSVSLQNLRISNVNNLTQTIDVTENGDLAIGVSEIKDIKIEMGDTAADTTGQFSAVALRSADGAETELVNNLDVTLNVGAHTTYIRNLEGRDAAAMTALDIPTAAQGGSVAIQSVAKLQITDMNVGAFGYTADQAAAKVGLTNILDADGNANTATSNLGTHQTFVTATHGAGATAYSNAAGSLAADGNLTTTYAADGTVTVTDAGGTDVTTTNADAIAVNNNAAAAGAVKQANGAVTYANGAAVNITGVQFYDTDTGGNKTYATIDQTIWAQGGSSASGGGVYIQIGEINGTLEVGGIELGGSSIGSLKVSDLNLAGMTQRIYGH